MPEVPPIAVPLVYVGAEDVPIIYANQFVIQHEHDAFMITVGQVSPPILLGDEAERREQAERLSYVPVKVVARLAVTRQRLVELIGVLQTNLQSFDQMKKERPDD